MMNTVFVYGLLKRGHRLSRVMPQDAYSGQAELDGYVMHDMGACPAIVRGDGRVRGEVYVVSDDKLEELDWIESAYNRETVMVTMESGREVRAFVYVWKMGSPDGSRIHGWWSRLNERVNVRELVGGWEGDE